METKKRNLGGRPRVENPVREARQGHRVSDWGRRSGSIHLTMAVNEHGRAVIRLEDHTPDDKLRRELMIPASQLPQMCLVVAETLQIDNPTQAWAQLRLAQLIATCAPERVDAALALLRPSRRQVDEMAEILGVLDQSMEATR